MKRVKLSFSNNFFETTYYQDAKNLSIKNYGIVINLDKQSVPIIDGSSIKFYKSYLLKDYKLTRAKKVFVTTFKFDPVRENKALNTFCLKNWESNKIRYPYSPEK